MIKINLLGEEVRVDPSRYVFIGGFAAALLLFVCVCAFLTTTTAGEIADLMSQQEELQGKLTRLQSTTKEVRELEKKKRELADKLVVIAKLKKSKAGPVRVLDDLNLALPEKSWLTEVKESAGDLYLSGFALDNQTVALFMKALEGSEYFSAVDLQESTQAERKGVKINQFMVKTKVSYTGRIRLASAAAAAGKAAPGGAAEDKKTKTSSNDKKAKEEDA